jgi:N-acyl-D-aspartate/D-glutamate deacylase
MHDLVIRRATIVDGTGAARFDGDIAVSDGVITDVGTVDGRGKREIDASGLLATPGFVDIHTHYDGQATWDTLLAPSSNHGVTSVVMGNCGVGFAPVRPDKHDFLISLMEGVEDIPGTALAEGLPWDWETLPEYFDAVDRRPHALDIGAQVPHAALRAYVMGERGADHEQDPTEDEILEMSRLTREALEAGALGFATSRTLSHRTRAGAKIGSLTAKQEELLGIGQALKDLNKGVFQFVSDWRDLPGELALLKRVAVESGRPLSVSLSQGQGNGDSDRWRDILDFIEQTASEGVDIKAQVCPRPVGVLLGLDASVNPFMWTPTYQSLAGLPLAERVAALSQPATRERILGEFRPIGGGGVERMATRAVESLFKLGDPPNYEPPRSEAIVEMARAQGADRLGAVYDALLERSGTALLYYPILNYSYFNLDVCRELALSSSTLPGLSDGGAHVGTICDASFTTYNLTHWCRDRSRGEQLDLELVVKRQTSDSARHVGWHDRGLVRPGYKADLNVIDFDALEIRAPYIVHDLPAGGRRLLQRANGYRCTIKSGEVTFENGESTGALPGRLVRGAQAAPR